MWQSAYRVPVRVRKHIGAAGIIQLTLQKWDTFQLKT